MSKTQKATSKRIHRVTIKRMVDESPDTSWLGEYADRPTSEYSIDREHGLDCPQQTYNAKSSDRCMMVIAYTDKLERAITHLENVKAGWINRNDTDEAKALATIACEELNEAQDILISAQDDIQDEANACDCGGHGDRERGQYRYFNPSFNYVDAQGKRLPENTDDEVRKAVTGVTYVRQDYERMERLNRGDWCFIGIAAEAEWSVPIMSTTANGDQNWRLPQTVHSGGLWGIESDSDASYLAEVEQEQLAELREQLKAIGFSSRAISAAFKNVERKED